MKKSLTYGCALLSLASFSARASDFEAGKVPDLSGLAYRSGYTFLNLQVAGTDYRPAMQITSVPGGYWETATLPRPWLKAGFSFSAPLPVLHPFLRLEVAAPVSTTSKGDSADELRKAVAPSFQVALYGGIRF